MEETIKYLSKLEYIDENDISLFGESQGGLISTIVANKYDIKNLILYYPAYPIIDDAQKRYKSFDDIPSRFIKFWHLLKREYYQDIYDIDLKEIIDNLDKRTLIVHGNKDKTVNIKSSRKYIKEFKNGCLIELNNEKHLFTKEGKKRAIEEVITFLKTRGIAS